MIDAVVIGAGAAGLMCARAAGRRGRSVTVLERGARIGAKILISGGGRCNFTNRHAGPENYLSSTPDFCKSALARFQPADFIALVEGHGIAYHEKKLGQLFCDHSSRAIVEMLQREVTDAGGRVQTSVEVRRIDRLADGTFRIETSWETLSARQVVIATGGLSLPKLGATDFAYRIARQFGLNVLEPQPGLVPFTASGELLQLCRNLSGVSLSGRVETVDRLDSPRRAAFDEAMLFTHRGLSGPAMLQISSYWRPGSPLTIDLAPDARAWLEEQRASAAQLRTVLARRWPARFIEAWLPRDERPLKAYSATELDEIARRLREWAIVPAGTEGYATAEVTTGGVDTRELSSKTFEARQVPGLHFIGESVDVTGWLGGFNFQWAWASGHACGEALT